MEFFELLIPGSVSGLKCQCHHSQQASRIFRLSWWCATIWSFLFVQVQGFRQDPAQVVLLQTENDPDTKLKCRDGLHCGQLPMTCATSQTSWRTAWMHFVITRSCFAKVLTMSNLQATRKQPRKRPVHKTAHSNPASCSQKHRNQSLSANRQPARRPRHQRHRLRQNDRIGNLGGLFLNTPDKAWPIIGTAKINSPQMSTAGTKTFFKRSANAEVHWSMSFGFLNIRSNFVQQQGANRRFIVIPPAKNASCLILLNFNPELHYGSIPPRKPLNKLAVDGREAIESSCKLTSRTRVEGKTWENRILSKVSFICLNIYIFTFI